jgi:hypothetical protein
MRADAVMIINTIDFMTILLHEAELGRVRYALDGAHVANVISCQLTNLKVSHCWLFTAIQVIAHQPWRSHRDL